MTAFDFETVQGNTPVWTDTLTYSDGSLANLTGATLAFIMRSLVSPAPLTLTGTASIVSPTLGTVQFAASAQDTAAAGQYMAQWKVTFANGSVMTFPTVGYLSVSIAENLVTAGGEQLVSVPDLKDYMNVPSDDRAHDAKLARLIRAARPIVENITGPIIPQIFYEWHDGGGSFIQIRRRPSTSYATTSILELEGTVDSTELGVTEYIGTTPHPLTVIPDPSAGSTYSCMVDRLGTITRRTSGGGAGCFYGGRGAVHVVYQAGQSAIPPNVYEGVLELLRVNYQTTMAVGSGRLTVSDDQDSGPPIGFFVPRKVRELLAPNRRAPSIA